MGVPIATYGSQAAVAQGVQAKLLPDYDVVHISLDPESAKAELPAVFGGDLDTASATGLGSNAGRAVGDRLQPKILFFGAGIPAADVEAITEAIKARAPDAHFVSINPEEIRAAGGSGPDFGLIASVLKEKFSGLS